MLGKTAHSFHSIHSGNRCLMPQWNSYSGTSIDLPLLYLLEEDGRMDEIETSWSPSPRRVADAKFFKYTRKLREPGNYKRRSLNDWRIFVHNYGDLRWSGSNYHDLQILWWAILYSAYGVSNLNRSSPQIVQHRICDQHETSESRNRSATATLAFTC